ncbi:beta-1,3-galactosyltransferase brn-like [Argopecten irradians]|uniref:beta-1,3-galactosyltransferase brn-like n=1 Tax=Argopecten irradians TaxID=31199 RepID=UPI0037204FA8
MGLFLLFSLPYRWSIITRDAELEKHHVKQHGFTRNVFETETHEQAINGHTVRVKTDAEKKINIFSNENNRVERNDTVGEPQSVERPYLSSHKKERKLTLVGKVKRYVEINDSVHLHEEQGTFSPDVYPGNVNLTAILQQHDTKRYANERALNSVNDTVIANPYQLCRDNDNIKVMFIVKSKPDHAQQRSVIRGTWANTKRFPSIRVIFSFGKPEDSSRLKTLLDESSTYGDMLIVGDYTDNYYNLTQKTLEGLQWAVTTCKRVGYVVSVDDDMYVAPDLLLKFLARPSVLKTEKLYSGHLMVNTKPIRNPKDKWHVSVSEYPFRNYPNYIFGGFVIMSMSTVKDFVIAAQYTMTLKFEDVYLGILASKVGIEASNNGYVNSRRTFTVSESFKTIIASHFYDNAKDLQRAWDCHLSILDQSDDKSIYCDYIGKRLQNLKSEIDNIASWMENVKHNS